MIMMGLKGLLNCLMYTFLFVSINCDASRTSHWSRRTPGLSIQTKNGDAIDCVHAFLQPRLDHALLKSQAAEMRPTNYAEDAEKLSNFGSSPIDGRCPKGTIPVRRTLKQEQLSLSSSFNSFGKNFILRGPFLQLIGSLQAKSSFKDVKLSGTWESAAVKAVGGPYHGAHAIMNIWEPHVQPNDSSGSKIWIAAGSSASDMNFIFVGWHVTPKRYGDNRTRFFIAWTRDGFQSTGCFNFRCPGFVQTNDAIAFGRPFPILSTIDGPQAEISILIWKDQAAWWLQYNNVTLGYWPLSLFTHLANNASVVGWGGFVLNSHSDGQQSTTTEMGSGHFPEEGLGRASYMRQLHVLDKRLTPRSLDSPRTIVQQPNCYNIAVGNNVLWGDFIFFGGPGRNPKCP